MNFEFENNSKKNKTQKKFNKSNVDDSVIDLR